MARVGRESRTCFGISFFETEEEANDFGKIVKSRGDTYNGGFMHGMACGRDASYDRIVEGKTQYAVTTS